MHKFILLVAPGLGALHSSSLEQVIRRCCQRKGVLGGVTVVLPAQLVLGNKHKQLHRSRVREDLQSPRMLFEAGLAWGSLPADTWLISDLCGQSRAQTDAHVKVLRALFLSKSVQW